MPLFCRNCCSIFCGCSRRTPSPIPPVAVIPVVPNGVVTVQPSVSPLALAPNISATSVEQDRDYILGDGKQSVVKLGKWHNGASVQSVALKKILKSTLNPNAAVTWEEVALQAKIMQQMQHPHVMSCYGVMQEGSSYYIVMDVMEGALKISLDPRVSREDRYRYAYELALGLQHIHQQGVWHRNLHVGNLLLSKDKRIKISGFGRACYKNPANCGGVGRETHTAPELFSDGGYNDQAEIFALGMTIWEIVTGKEPYADVRDQERDTKIRHGAGENIPTDLAAEVAWMIRACWSWEPSTRPDLTTIVQTLQPFARKI